MLCHDLALTSLKIISSLTELSLDGWQLDCSRVWKWYRSNSLDALWLWVWRRQGILAA